MKTQGTLDKLKITVVAEDSVLYESPYLGQHGISILLEAENQGTAKKILVDVGQHPEALISNMRSMGIRPSDIDAVVLTHCHYDHTQGLVRVLHEIDREDIQVIAHPGIFRLHFVTGPHHIHVGMRQGDSKDEIEKAGGRLSLSREPFTLMAGVMTTGEIDRQFGFEKMRTKLKTVENDVVVEDQLLDDISLTALIKERRLVIVTGCSHAGIVNITHQAVELTGCSKIESIIGGLHLVDACNAVLQKTIGELSRLDIAHIYAGHCTGFKAQAALCAAFGDRFQPLQTGMRFEW